MQLLHFAKVLTGRRRKLLARYLLRLVGLQRRRHDPLRVFEAILHVLRTGVQWRDLDDDPRFPPTSAVYYYSRALVESLRLRSAHPDAC